MQFLKIKLTLIFAVSAVCFIAQVFPVQAQFGKNKVQYQKFEWKYIQSTHFDIYYNAGSKYLAEYTAVTAEEAMAEYASLINYKPDGRSTIIVYDSHNDFQQTNAVLSYMPEGVGGVTELYKNRVILPFRGDYSEFRHVIRHELIHSIVNFMFYGGTYQTAVQTRGLILPLWMNEGLAEYASLRGLDTDTDMFMRDLVLNENLPPLERLNGYLAYRGGQIFYWYIEQKYGKGKIADLLNTLRFAIDIDDAFLDIFNKDLDDFSEQWKEDMKKMYYPDLPKYKNPKDFAVRLTNQEEDKTYYNSSPAVSPDGRKMAYISAPEGIYSVFVRDIDDKESAEKLVSSMRAQDFEDLNMLTPGISWSPDGKRIAVSAKAGGEDAIFSVDAESGDYEKIQFGIKSVTSVEWSPDGDRIAFIGSNGISSDIFIYSFAADTIFNLTNDIYSERVPVWSPDGNAVYFISDRGDDTTTGTSSEETKMWRRDVDNDNIYRLSISDKKIERITPDNEFSLTSLAISSDESKLLYVSDRNGIGNLYELTLDDRTVRPLTNSITGIEQISLSPDSQILLFSAQTKGGIDIYMMRRPFENRVEGDSIPKTELRKKLIAEKETEKSLSEIEDTSESEDIELGSYGDFEVDFSRQELVEPNPDAQDRIQNNGDVKIAADAARINDQFIEYDYEIKFTQDLIAGNPGYSTYYGFQGVAQMLFSDRLGDRRIYAQANIYRDLKNSSINVAYQHLPGLYDWTVRAGQYAGYIYGDYPDNVRDEIAINEPYPYSAGYYRFRNITAGVTVARPTSMFQRFEFATDFMYLIKENYSFPEYESSQNIFLAVPKLRAVCDNTLWGYYGPNRGFRGFAELLASPKLGKQGAEFATLKTDLRYYLPIGRWFSFAFRGAGGASFGTDAQNFYLGGQEMWINYRYKNNRLPVDNPVDFAFMEFQMPLRGWAVGEIGGSKFFAGNAEFRFPLFTALVAGPLPILIQGVQGCLFYDAGGAFYDEFNFTAVDQATGKTYYDDFIMSTGLGVRAYMLGIPLKLDIAWSKHVEGWSEPQYIFSMGLDF